MEFTQIPIQRNERFNLTLPFGAYHAIHKEHTMGYTHYFPQNRKFTTEEWNKIQAFAKELFLAEKDILANGNGTPGTKPSATKTTIMFNGVGDESHETCVITKAIYDGFNFTKTARKEYDKVVVALLTYINHVAPLALNISSDGQGEPNMFVQGTALAQIIGKDIRIQPLFA